MNDLRRKIEDLLCEDAWKRDYPQGGSVYKTYQSTPFHDKELYRKEVAPMVDAIWQASRPASNRPVPTNPATYLAKGEKL